MLCREQEWRCGPYVLPRVIGISREGLLSAATFLLHVLSSVVAVLWLTLSTRWVDLLRGLAGRPPFALCGGEMKKVALASILVMDPQVLLLDEPTAGLDPRSSRVLVDCILRHAHGDVWHEHEHAHPDHPPGNHLAD